MTFVEFNGIILSIRSYKMSLNLQEGDLDITEGPCIPLQLRIILKRNKGCKDMYDIFIQNDSQPTSVRKWNDILNLDDNFNWNYCFHLPFRSTYDTHLRFFQYRINHRILGTNSFLLKLD